MSANEPVNNNTVRTAEPSTAAQANRAEWRRLLKLASEAASDAKDAGSAMALIACAYELRMGSERIGEF